MTLKAGGRSCTVLLNVVLIMLLHWTVATKQPAMTAPAMAAKLAEVRSAASTRGEADDVVAVEAFVDQVAHLIRSQVAGIVGNLACWDAIAVPHASRQLDALFSCRDLDSS